MAPTLLIVDDHERFRAFAKMLLAAEGFDVTGEAATGEDALAAVEELHPDVVLLDVQLPGIDGFEVAERLANGGNGPCVILTSTRDASEFGSRLTASPAHAFLTKSALSGEALAALVATR